ncbi:hypothetical protein BDV19DRAFT_358277 [Aspergillus venezuelensis]
MRALRSGLLARRSWVCMQCRSASTKPATASHNKAGLPNFPARTRFAPSPTGYLHLGSLRTALFNYLLAKRTGGQFLLRIEDTDQARTIPGAEQRLYDDLNWAGLNWDEGPVVGGAFGPYRQSERTNIYRKHTHDLINDGHAYRCFCSKERLDKLARHRSESGLAPGYDRTCTELSAKESEERAAKGESHVVRLKVDKYPDYKDLVYGTTGKNRSKKLDLLEGADILGRVYDDPILLKSDGHPTYHLANVVDDHLMEISHVIRGTEWMSSTPMHVALYNAFGWTPPNFAHVPLLVEPTGEKLSKRNRDIDLAHFRDKQGVFAASLLNFSALLGWSHTGKSDIFSLEELEKIFTLKITRGNTVVAFEKLWFLQKAHAQRFAATEGPEFNDMVAAVSKEVENTMPADSLSQILQSRPLSDLVAPLLKADAKSYATASEFVSRNATFFSTSIDRPEYTPVSSTLIPISSLHTAAAALTLVPNAHWNITTHKFNISSYDGASALQAESEDAGIPIPDEKSRIAADKAFKKELYHYLRWALSAGAPGPGIPETMVILGRDESVRRLTEGMGLTRDVKARSPVAERLVRGKEREREKAKGKSEGEGLLTGGKEKDLSWMGSLAPKE